MSRKRSTAQRGLSPEQKKRLNEGLDRLEKAIEKAEKMLAEIKKDAAIAQPVVRRLGKAEVVGSSPTRSSKLSKKELVARTLEVLIRRTKDSCLCDGGGTLCSACAAERKLKAMGYIEIRIPDNNYGASHVDWIKGI